METFNILLYFTLAAFISSEGIYDRQKDNQWFKDGTNLVKENLDINTINKKAKGVILMIGDGMGMTTVTAGRILDGQLKGQIGEENVLNWETYKNVALSKTYNVDQTVPDSAGTATAFMTGVKSNAGVISVNEHTIYENCSSSKGNDVLSIIMMAEKAGLSTGVVTTARMTHATPATAYSHSASRYWENDVKAKEDCKDIASQLIDFPYGDGLEVVLGGGRREFVPNNVADPENPKLMGKRNDSRNLIQEWKDKSSKKSKFQYVWKEDQFKSLDAEKEEHVLGLFNYDHMEYSYNRKNDTAGEPSLAEMVEFAVKVLNKNPKGYVLLVEAGRIDHGHHENKAFHALHDTVAFNEAVGMVNKITKSDETLVIVTADHSHVFTVGGYQTRGNPIFGFTNKNSPALDGQNFTTLGYYNGPGAQINGSRKAPTAEQLKNPEFEWTSSLVPLVEDTHGGEDVGIYARGVQAHMIQGVVEQNYIFHVMDYALCLSESKEAICIEEGLIVKPDAVKGASQMLKNNILLMCICIFLLWLFK